MTPPSAGRGSAVETDLGGTRVRLDGDATQALEALREDFAAFPAEPGAAATIELTLSLDSEAPPPAGTLALVHRRYRAYDRGAARTIVYADGARASYDFGSRRGLVQCGDPDRLRELAYLAVLSRAGEALEGAGLRRVHALGFGAPAGAGLVILPEGGGKSVLALGLLRAGGLGLYSDDSPLVDESGFCRPFPLRLAVRRDVDLSALRPGLVRDFRRLGREDKRLISWEAFPGRVASPAPCRWLLLGRRTAGRPALTPASPASAAWRLGDALVLGRGLAQMSEYMLGWSPRRVGELAGLALGRARAARTLLRLARAFWLDLGPDADENAAFLCRLAARGEPA